MTVYLILGLVATACMIRSLAAVGFRAVVWAALCLCAVFTGLVWSNHADPAVAAASGENTGQSGYPVVAVGDSILQLVPPFLWPAGWHIDAQGARQPLAPPLHTFDGATPTSTRDALAADVPLVAPGGVLIVQDVVGPLAPWGMTLDDWADMIAAAVDALPDDRCLIVVTGYWPDDTGRNGVEQSEMNRVMVDLAAGQPCHRVVGWADAVADDPDRLDPDGRHPSIAGSLWLSTALTLTVIDVAA